MSKRRREKQKKAKEKASKMVNASWLYKGLDLTKVKETAMLEFQEALKRTLK